MILDYAYNRNSRVLSVSYVQNNGQKRILKFDVDRFKTYYSTPSGRFKNWDGTPCDVKWTDRPSTFDIHTFLEELPDQYKILFQGRTAPKLYTFDIETEISDEFPEPSSSKFAITTISIANENCDVIQLGTKPLEEAKEEWIRNQIHTYLKESQFFGSTGLELPKFKYIHFETERDMLEYFLVNIVSKVAIIAGWNSILFDWQYIQNRIRFYYPDLSLSMASMTRNTYPKTFVNMRNEKVRLDMPQHTLVLDMMDVIGNFDMVVMPIKESLSLDYIASNSIGMHKIKYDGSLQDLFERDYPKYAFYNCIDSILVQLINKKFRTLQNIYMQSLYCRERIGVCFSKIALTEALVWNYFYENNIKVVPMMQDHGERGKLVGAYVREPSPGKHRFVCCNDFASLYPSTIITCNLSFENFMGSDFTPEQIEKFKKDPNYFVSVNGNVYKNDKQYAFAAIQAKLKATRNISKYMSKKLEATVMTDLEHLISGKKFSRRAYEQDVQDHLEGMGYSIACPDDFEKVVNLSEFRTVLKEEISFLTANEQAMKLLGNSGYGGSSHASFFWFNIGLANDITGEARNLIHLMEKHIPEYMTKNWASMTELHKQLGITLKKEYRV